jgi:transposase
MTSRTTLESLDTRDRSVLYTALDVGDDDWEMALTAGDGTIRTKTIEAGDFQAFQAHLQWAEEAFELPADVPVACCHEAGRQGFWVHRKLSSMGIASGVVDPGSLSEQKKGDRAKTDRIDAEKLVDELVRWCSGHRDHTLSFVEVPDREDEDLRHLFREEEQLIEEQTERINRIQGLLKTQGIDEFPTAGTDAFEEWLEEEATTANGNELGEHFRNRLRRESERLRRTRRELDEEVVAERSEHLRQTRDSEATEKVQMLTMLRGIGEKTAFAFVVEMFGWRDFENRREVGAYVGLDPQRYDSGNSEQDRSITRQGNDRVRRLAVQMARNWLNFQPDSHLAEWAQERFETNRGGVSNRGVIALARKLLNRLRVYLEEGEPPWGAQMGPPAF